MIRLQQFNRNKQLISIHRRKDKNVKLGLLMLKYQGCILGIYVLNRLSNPICGGQAGSIMLNQLIDWRISEIIVNCFNW